MNNQKKSIEIGEMLIVLDGKKEMWLWNKSGEAMNLTKDSLKKLEEVLSKFFEENF